MTLKNKKILITGAHGFLGSHLVEFLIKKKIKNLILPTQKEYDLKKLENCRKIVKNVDIVIHLAAKVGGIGFNLKYPGSLFYDNLVMGIQLMDEARKAGVKKFVALGTICGYPKFTPIPFKEKNLWNGYPEITNAPYGLAKKMLLVQSQAYRKQYSFNSIFLLPVNMYGPRDNFHLEYSHVIAAVIRKIYEAKKQKKNYIKLWGDGSPTREFLYVEDCARAIILATEKYNKGDPVNIGSGKEIKIKDLAEMIAKLMDFKGKIIWDKSRPKGQPRRMLDVSFSKREFNFEAKMDLKKGLEKTIEWYIKEKS